MPAYPGIDPFKNLDHGRVRDALLVCAHDDRQ